MNMLVNFYHFIIQWNCITVRPQVLVLSTIGKLTPNIHLTPAVNDIELRYVYVIKLKESQENLDLKIHIQDVALINSFINSASIRDVESMPCAG